MFVTIIAVELSRVYQNTQSALKGCVNDRCLEAIAHAIVKTPNVNGKTSRTLRFLSMCAFRIIGIGMLIIIRSELRLKARLSIRWCSAVVHSVFDVGVCQ